MCSVPSPSGAGLPGWMRHSYPDYALPCCKAEQGFSTELWTLRRVGAVIERLHGVRFSQTQVWRILGALGFSPQKPDKRAIERDEDAVRHWKRYRWPALKKKPSAKAA